MMNCVYTACEVGKRRPARSRGVDWFLLWRVMDVDGASRVDSSGCVRNNGANLILWNLMAIVRNNNNGAKGASIFVARGCTSCCRRRALGQLLFHSFLAQ